MCGTVGISILRCVSECDGLPSHIYICLILLFRLNLGLLFLGFIFFFFIFVFVLTFLNSKDVEKIFSISLTYGNIENEQTTYTHRFGRARKMRKMRMNDKIEHTHVRNIQAKRHTKKNVQSWQKKNHQQNFLNLRDFKIKKNNACQRKTWFCYFIYETDTIILFFFVL